MKITVKSEVTDLTYYAKYKDALFDLAKEERRLLLIGELMKSFEIKLNALKIDTIDRPSDNWLHFSRFYGKAWFDVSLGIEELTLRLSMPKDEQMVKVLYGNLIRNIGNVTFDFQRMTIQRHFSTEADVKSYLESMNPNCPPGFKEDLEGIGVFYTLASISDKWTIHITLVNSLRITGGLFLSVEILFASSQYDFERAFSVAKERYDFIVEQLNIDIVEE